MLTHETGEFICLNTEKKGLGGALQHDYCMAKLLLEAPCRVTVSAK